MLLRVSPWLWFSGPEAFDTALLNAQLELNRKVIEGPSLQEEPGLRALGWSPEVIVQGYERKASDELAQVRRFDDDPTWRLGRTRDVITAREVLIEVGDIFAEGFAARGPGAIDHFLQRSPTIFAPFTGQCQAWTSQ